MFTDVFRIYSLIDYPVASIWSSPRQTSAHRHISSFCFLSLLWVSTLPSLASLWQDVLQSFSPLRFSLLLLCTPLPPPTDSVANMTWDRQFWEGRAGFFVSMWDNVPWPTIYFQAVQMLITVFLKHQSFGLWLLSFLRSTMSTLPSLAMWGVQRKRPEHPTWEDPKVGTLLKTFGVASWKRGSEGSLFSPRRAWFCKATVAAHSASAALTSAPQKYIWDSSVLCILLQMRSIPPEHRHTLLATQQLHLGLSVWLIKLSYS